VLQRRFGSDFGRYFSYILTDVRKLAKLFKTGGSQAVRLPREFRFDDDAEVWIHREGGRVILEAALPQWSKDFLDLAGSARGFPYPPDVPGIDSPPDDLD
jgi:virulence-associated protein VagC